MNHLRDALERLRAAGLTANKAKCEFASNNIKILGFVVKDVAIHPDDSKIQAIKDWKQPKNKHQLKSFLGMVNFFHRHIDHYATKAAPLTDLLPRNKPDKLQWTDKEQNAFDNLKAALMAKPIIRPPNPEKGYVMYTDGSSVAISAVLMQTGDNDEDEYVVAYASKKLTPAEKKYAII